MSYDDFINDPWPSIKRWSRSLEGKAAIYGSLFCAIVVISGGILAQAIAPRIARAVIQSPRTFKVVCNAQNHKYLFGVYVFAEFSEDNVGQFLICKDSATGRWIPANPALDIQVGRK